MRRSALLGTLGVALVARPARAQELTTIHLATSRISSDAPFWIADRLGYFREEGLKVEYTFSQSSEITMPLLSSGQLDFGGSAAGAALYNGVIRGVDVRAVADTGTDPPGYGWAQLLVRTEVMKSGRFKGIKDLKGMTVCGAARASSSAPQLARVLARAGLKYSDVKREVLPYVQHQVALQNGAIDASLTVEPFATFAVEAGAAVKIMGNDVFYPNQQVSCLIASGQIVKGRRDVGIRFVRAFIRAARYYNDALHDGHITGLNAENVIKILAAEIGAPEALIQRVVPVAMNPNGRLNLTSMKEDLAFYKSQGFIEGNISANEVVDDTLVGAVLRQLGPYKPRRTA